MFERVHYRHPISKNHAKRRPQGYDAGKKVKRRKRHILTNTLGLMLKAVVHTADIQDRDGGPLVLKHIRERYPFLFHIFAMGATPITNFLENVRKSACGRSKSSNDPILPKASCITKTMSRRTTLAWLTATDILPKTSSALSNVQLLGSSSNPSKTYQKAHRDEIYNDSKF